MLLQNCRHVFGRKEGGDMEMESKPVPEVELNSGHKMPMLGFGTYANPCPPSDVLFAAFMAAIRAGYRHFDTASSYGSEEPLGQALAQARQQGLIKCRNEIFVTTKLWCCDAHPDLVLPALRSSLQRLAIEYVDLYLVHFPVRLRHEIEGHYNFSKEDILPFDIKGTWEAMEECSILGIAKSVGVSNFGIRKLSELVQHSTITPAVNQVEMNVAWQQRNLRNFCEEKGIHVSAWSPLGANGAAWGTRAVMESPILKDIAIAIGKSVPQVALRWILQQGVTPAVKSFNSERMKQNLQIFDWELSEVHLEKIRQIPQRRAWRAENFVSENGPYKSLEDIWDGEI